MRQCRNSPSGDNLVQRLDGTAKQLHLAPVMSTREALLAEIEKFLRDTGMSPTAFGLKSLNDSALVSRLRKGADLRSANIDKIRDFMARERNRSKPKRPSRGPMRADACTA